MGPRLVGMSKRLSSLVDSARRKTNEEWIGHDGPRETPQKALWDDHPATEDANYLSSQLLTYIGNKRSLLDNIAQAVERVKHRLGKDHLRVFDVFAGSGVVSRFLKAHASLLVSNDFEDYAAIVGRCYLRNRSTVDFRRLGEIVDDLNARVDSETFPKGFIEELYAPKDENQITAEDRVFLHARTPAVWTIIGGC